MTHNSIVRAAGADRKSSVENFTPPTNHHLPLTTDEKARRVAELRAVLYAPTFRARKDATDRRARP